MSNRHHGRFIQNYILITDVNKGVRSAQVYGQIAGKKTSDFLEHGSGIPKQMPRDALILKTRNSSNGRDLEQGTNMLT
jgi:hypothetical protein